MESGHFIDASSSGTTITTASGTVVVGGGGAASGGTTTVHPKVAYQVSRVVPIASAAVSQSQLHPVAGEISTVEDDGDGGGNQTSSGTIQAVLTNGLNGQVSLIKFGKQYSYLFPCLIINSEFCVNVLFPIFSFMLLVIHQMFWGLEQ